MKKKSGLLFLFIVVVTAAFSQTKLILIPTIHGLHKTNTLYNYDSLKVIVERLDPDVIAVEIRNIEVGADTSYLKKNYPYEMWMMRYWFPLKTMEGFDWLGTDLEGKTIPEKYWKEESKIKMLERQLDQDSVYEKRLTACQEYTDARLKILRNRNLYDILNSDDAQLTKGYYSCMQQQLKGSLYEQLPDFYNERNRQMETALNALIQKYPGKKIVVLTGDDHYPYLLEYLKTTKVQLLNP